MRYFLSFIFFSFFIKITTAQTTIILSGYVTDEYGETLVSANVFNKTISKGTITNEYGFYSLEIDLKDSVDLQISYIGYETLMYRFYSNNDHTLDFKLKTKALTEIVVSQKEIEKIETQTQISTVNLPIERLKKIPTLAGEVDIMKALSLTPGVVNGTEGTSGLFVRGGTPDQNLILLDGATVYNPNHLFGFLSVFNPDAIKNIELTKAGFPARYGGRLASVLDISMKEGNTSEVKGTFNIGLISSKLTLEIPVIKDKMSFIFSGRASYLGLVFLPQKTQYVSGKRDDYLNYFMTDWNAKLSYILNKKQRIYLSFYKGDDAFRGLERTSQNSDEGQVILLNWGNLTTTLRHTYQITPQLFWKNNLIYTKYYYGFEQETTETFNNKTEISKWNNISSLWDIGIKSTFDYLPNNDIYIKFGVEGTRHTFQPQSSSFEVNDSLIHEKESAYQTYEFSSFVENEWEVSSNFKTNIGLRYAVYATEEEIYHSIEPRINFVYKLPKKIGLKAAYSRMQQPTHLLSTLTLGLQNDIWVPSTAAIRPQIAHQWALGLAKSMGYGIELTLEGYYKKNINLIEYEEGSSLILNIDQFWYEYIETNGTGSSYGMEFFINKTNGNLTGMMAYTLSKHTRQFSNINEGKVYPFQYDYRHDFSITSNYQFSKKWNISGTWVYRSGQPFTLPIFSFDGLDDDYTYLIGGERNARRLPAYHRADIGLNYRSKTTKDNWQTWSFSIYNTYNRKNIHQLRVIKEWIYDDKGNKIGSKQVIKPVTILPIIPSVSYSLSF